MYFCPLTGDQRLERNQAFQEHASELTLRLPFGFIVNRPEPAGLVATGAGAHVPCCQLSHRNLSFPGHESSLRDPRRAAGVDRTYPANVTSVQILNVCDESLKPLLISEHVWKWQGRHLSPHQSCTSVWQTSAWAIHSLQYSLKYAYFRLHIDRIIFIIKVQSNKNSHY